MASEPNKWTDKIRATRQQVQRVWALSKPYFSSEQKWQARGLLFAIVALNLAVVYLNVLFNDWNRVFYDSLQDKNEAVFWEQLGRFTYLAFGFIVVMVYKFYLTQLLDIRWRAWMTDHYLARWFSSQAFYRFELGRYHHGNDDSSSQPNPDNPDQRIQVDVGAFINQSLSLSMGLLNSVVSLASFVGILWTLSGAFSFHLLGNQYVIPGFMVWMALLYCGFGSVLTHYIGRPQIGLNFQQQRLEADFRHRMMRVREYSESIALDRGEAVEKEQINQRFGRVLTNYLSLIRAQKRLIWFTSFFGQAAVVFPFVVAAPRYFSGAIKLGDLTQISGAFGEVQGALSWFVNSYPDLADWRATTDRLTGFDQSLGTFAPLTYARESAHGQISNSVAKTGAQGTDLTVSLPGGAVILAHAGVKVNAGDTVLLEGPSGSGKSTLFRTLAGIWPFATGHVERAADSQFLPQRAYFPEGPLRDAVAYPEAAQAYSDAAIQQALKDALLPGLTDKLDVSDAWGQKLSGGELQRLAIARVLLKQPRWIFADEATSALDEASAGALYQRLKDLAAQRNGALVSIAHLSGAAEFQGRRWQLVPQAPGSAALFKLVEKAA